MALGQLVVRLGLDAADFTQGMSRSEAEAQRFAAKLASDITSAATAVTVGLGAIAVGAAAAFKLINDQVENIAAFQQLSEKIGDTAENLASLKTASDVSGTSMDSIAAASVKLTAALSKTDEEGQGAAKAVKALGLDFNDFKKLSPVEQIDAVALAMGGFEDGANKTAVATALWGKSGADMIPLLNDLANGSERQITLTQDQISAADNFSKSISRLVSEAGTLKQQLVAELVPTLSDLLKAFSGAGGAADSAGGKLGDFGGVTSAIRTGIKDTTAAVSDLAGAISKLLTLGGGFVKFSKNLVAGNLDIADKAITETANELREKNKFYKSLFDNINNAGNSTNKKLNSPLDGGFGADSGGYTPVKNQLAYDGIKTPSAKGGKSGGAEKQSEADKYLANLQRQLEATDKLSVSAALLRDIDLGRLGVLLPAQQEELLFIAQKIDAVKANELAEKTAADVKKQAWDSEKKSILENFKSYDEAAQKKLEVGEALRQSVMTDMEQIIAQELLYNKYLADGTITLETYGRLMDQLQDKVVALDKPFQTLKDIGSTATQSLVDGMANAIQSSKKLEDVFRGVIKQLGTMILKALFFKAIEIGLNAVEPGLGTAISGARATGGPVNAGKSYLVGEKGPELFSPNNSGKITTNAQTFRSQGGGGAYTNVYNISAPGVSREEFTAGLNRSQAGAVSDVRDNRLRRRA